MKRYQDNFHFHLHIHQFACEKRSISFASQVVLCEKAKTKQSPPTVSHGGEGKQMIFYLVSSKQRLSIAVTLILIRTICARIILLNFFYISLHMYTYWIGQHRVSQSGCRNTQGSRVLSVVLRGQPNIIFLPIFGISSKNHPNERMLCLKEVVYY
jgi:hypothetical protein